MCEQVNDEPEADEAVILKAHAISEKPSETLWKCNQEHFANDRSTQTLPRRMHFQRMAAFRPFCSLICQYSF